MYYYIYFVLITRILCFIAVILNPLYAFYVSLLYPCLSEYSSDELMLSNSHVSRLYIMLLVSCNVPTYAIISLLLLSTYYMTLCNNKINLLLLYLYMTLCNNKINLLLLYLNT